VLAIYTAQAAVMGFIGALGGVVLGIGIQFLMPYALKDFLPVDVEVRLAPMAILVGLGVGVWVALLFSLRPLVALRRVSPLQALRREPDADALRRARWDPLRLLLSFAIGASVLGLSLSRANTVRRGVGFAVAIGLAIGIPAERRRPVVAGATFDSPVVAVPVASGCRQSVSARKSDARGRARAGLRRVSHGHAVPGAIQHSSFTRPPPR
jgi:putative ABC transport system permease protein